MRSVRVMLTGTFLALIAAASGGVWLLADYYNRKNIGQLAGQIQRELAHRIDVRVGDLLETPHRLNAMGGRIVQGAQLDLSQPHSANRVFHSMLVAHPHINALFFGGESGVMYGARWSRDRSYTEVMVANEETQGALNYYRATQDGTPAELVESAPDYDPRSRSWYADAVEENKPIWSPIYLDFATRALVMTAAQPIQRPDGERMGVLGCGIQFEQIDDFLQGLAIGTSGIAYLMERDGTLVSTSAKGHAIRLDGTRPERIRAEECPNPLIRMSAQQLEGRYGPFTEMPHLGAVPLTLTDGPAFGSTFYIRDGFGLDWLGVIVVPEADYMAVVQERNRAAFALFLVGLLCALLAGLVSARLLTRPLSQLAAAADGVVQEAWDAPLNTARRDEFGALARAFDAMRKELKCRIGELQAARNALRESEARYALAQEAARVATWDWDFAADEIRWREQNEPIVAREAGDHRTTVSEHLERVHAEDRDVVAQAAKAAVAGEGDYDLEYRLARADGAMRWLSVKGDLIHNGEGAPVGLTGVLLDISDRKRLEEQLREAQKMDAIGRLAGGVAHDFNNLLQAILGFAEMGLEDTRPGTALHEDLTEIIRAGERATQLVRQLLAFSRRQILTLGPIALDHVVAEMAKMLTRLISETIDFQVESRSGSYIVRADRGQLEQILINLCVNARDAMPGGGTLTISVESEILSPEFCAKSTWARPGSYHVLRVSDTGEGMDPHTLSLVFEPFFTTKEVGKGTGLGLATVYGIVEQHKGLIHVISEPGAGSTFNVYFPAISEVATEIEAAVPTTAPRGCEAILLAEDDSAVRYLARRILDQAGYTIFEADDGDAAIELFEEHQNEIGAAFLDVVMPGKSGRAVFEHLRSRVPDLPILFASGYAEEGVHLDFVLEEGLTLIKKPYTRDVLLGALHAIIHSNERPEA